jgi:ATP-dependent DNA helicase RecQ
MGQLKAKQWTVQELEKILYERFGYQTFREHQLDVIRSVLDGRDTLLVQSTGGGKSLCYQLPSLLLPQLTVVISPLISLMEDQVSAAKRMGRKDTVAIHGAMESEKRAWIIQQLNRFSLVYISPEGIQHPQLLKALLRRGVSLFVVDEAHCISQWGHDFRLDYMRLAQIRHRLGNPTCLALTATAPVDVRLDIINSLEMREPVQLIHSVDRSNIVLKVERVESDAEKKERICTFAARRQDAGMIYCMSRQKTEELCSELKRRGIQRVAYYHGGMNAEDRAVIQQQFLQGKLRVICATSAFGMGINKADVRYVIHYHFPGQLEAYVQEIGRCSRDGQAGLSYVLYQQDDELIHHQLMENEYVSLQQIENMFTFERSALDDNASREKICQSIGCTEQVLEMVLYHLETLQQQAGDRKQIAAMIYQRMERQRRKKLKRIAQMRRWLQKDDGCRRSTLLRYFSESASLERRERCCDVCGLQEAELYTDIDGCERADDWHVQLASGHWKNKLLRLLPCERASVQKT